MTFGIGLKENQPAILISRIARRCCATAIGSFTASCGSRIRRSSSLSSAWQMTPFYRFIESTWMAQQIPWALLFFGLGGLPWVVWGICVRVAASVTGHWLVGYFAHNRGPRSWHIEGAGVQGYNVRYCGLITMGEAWHNNHHAFPASARLGLHAHETDPGWGALCVLARLGLVWDLKTPERLPPRQNLVSLRR